jgi:hypothetical protein
LINKKNVFKIVLNILMILCFIIIALTGILKSRELLRPLNISFDKLPMQQISNFHDHVGLLFLILILIHLFTQRSSNIYTFIKNFFSSKLFSYMLTFIIAAVIIILVALMLRSHPFPQQSEEIKKLQIIEIKQYHGENLSSIAAFRENSIKGPQYVDIKDYSLNIEGLVNKKLTLSYDDVLKKTKYTKVITLNCVEGWSAKILWEGVLLKDLLNEAGIKAGSNTVIFHAHDGYTSSLPLNYILNKNILLAYKMNGVTIPHERGYPFQVIAEDKWGYKWVKWVTKIELSNDTNYKGYWERAGYNQNGDLSGPIFEE